LFCNQLRKHQDQSDRRVENPKVKNTENTESVLSIRF
jgi:hypothetical protein